MICTDDDAIAERCRIMALHGISKDAWKRYTAEGSWYYEIVAPGYKYNMTDIQASIGIHQLRRLDGFIRRRREIASAPTRPTRTSVEHVIAWVAPFGACRQQT